jgi:hypothetical protein
LLGFLLDHLDWVLGQSILAQCWQPKAERVVGLCLEWQCLLRSHESL